MKSMSLRWRLRYGLTNAPLLLGGGLVLFLLLAAAIGPHFLPREALRIDRVRVVGGEWSVAPFPPSSLFPLGSDPLGRDLLSLLIYGASQTLAIAAAVTLARVITGSVLGTIAGWNRDSLIDRAILSLAGYISAFPTLILGIALIYALGIRKGQSTFIVALCLVGWTEIAQYVRSEVMVLKEKPFIEGARAIGLGSLGILTRHALPNMLPSLLALASLEMGAALLILAELGFVGVFVGGGVRVESVDASSLLHYFDSPEWGAMLGNTWRYFRTAFWVPFFPALAFFVAILGFNLLGMGLQSFFERTRFNVASISFGRLAVALVVVFLVTRSVLAGTGQEAQYASLAKRFNTQRAMGDIEALSSPEMDGRLAGTPGQTAAAQYIATQLKAAGVQPIPVNLRPTYFQTYPKVRVDLLELPTLSLLDEAGRVVEGFTYRADFAEKGYSGGGQAEGELLVTPGWSLPSREAARGKVLLLIAENYMVWPRDLQLFEVRGILTVVPDDYPLWQKRPSFFQDDEPYSIAPDRHWSGPWLNISESAANRLLRSTGQTVAQLRKSLPAQPVPILETNIRVRLSHRIDIVQNAVGINILGMIPGVDEELRSQIVVLAAHYNGPGRDPDGTLYPGANENASGVAILMEIARTWYEQGFEPKRSVVFLAWSEGGARYYARHPVLPYPPDATLAVLQLDALGQGEGNAIRLDRDAPSGLLSVAQRGASKLRVPTRVSRVSSILYFRAEEYPSLVLTRAGMEGDSLTPEDTFDKIDPRKVEAAGRLANLIAMLLSAP